MKNLVYNDLLPDVSSTIVQNLRGEELKLESLWETRRIILCFLRHFG